MALFKKRIKEENEVKHKQHENKKTSKSSLSTWGKNKHNVQNIQKNIEKVKNPDVATKKKAPVKILTGIKGFDVLFKEGIPDGSSVILEGGPGSGKTLFCLNLTHNMCLSGKKVLYMSFEEPAHRLMEHMDDFGWDAEKFVDKGLLKIQRFNALDISRSVEALLSEAKKELLIEVQPMIFPKDFKPDVVVIDSLTSISSAFSGEESRFRIYMEQLFRYLEKTNITSFLIREVSIPTHTGQTYSEPGAAVSFLSDGIIVIYYERKKE